MSAHTPGPWEYVPSTENHGAYITTAFGSTICDCYMMSDATDWSVRNGGKSKPVPFMAEMADPNARLIAAAPDMLAALQTLLFYNDGIAAGRGNHYPQEHAAIARAAIAKATGAA